MLKLDSRHPALTLPSAPALEAQPPHRLIVLIPDIESDYNSVMQRIWELARTLESRVLFLGLCRDETEEPRIHRELITMSALLQDGWVSAEARVEVGTNWLKAIKSNWQTGDVIACFSEQYVGLTHRPLQQIIESNLKATVYVLEGLYSSKHQRADWLSTVLVWVVSLGIIAGFSWLQLKINQLPDEMARNILLYPSLFFEVGLIWGWNSLFS
jgi:hypothetical protein